MSDYRVFKYELSDVSSQKLTIEGLVKILDIQVQTKDVQVDTVETIVMWCMVDLDLYPDHENDENGESTEVVVGICDTGEPISGNTVIRPLYYFKTLQIGKYVRHIFLNTHQ